jgi:hypothetical protein
MLYAVAIIITEWALDSYLRLKHVVAFTTHEYWTRLRPDVELLHAFPNDPKFLQSNFWGPVTDKSGTNISGAYKMKWHNIGGGNVQLRLLVAIMNGDVHLCDAYNKNSPAVDKRMAATMQRRMNVIHAGQHTIRGTL